jgi:hypothetical protein
MEPLLTDITSTASPETSLLRTPLYDLHLELGARMVPFAGYSMPVQYPAGLMAEHLHTRASAGLFDVSHMGQLSISGDDAAVALESLMPVDVIGLAPGRQRYGMLLNENAGILDDLMFTRRATDFLVIVNGACKVADTAHIQHHIGARCQVTPLPDAALLALQGPLAARALERLVPGVGALVFMSGQGFVWQGHELFLTRSGYTGEDGFEISIPSDAALAFARALWALRGAIEAGRPPLIKIEYEAPRVRGTSGCDNVALMRWLYSLGYSTYNYDVGRPITLEEWERDIIPGIKPGQGLPPGTTPEQAAILRPQELFLVHKLAKVRRGCERGEGRAAPYARGRAGDSNAHTCIHTRVHRRITLTTPLLAGAWYPEGRRARRAGTSVRVGSARMGCVWG